jgi:ribosomal protein L37AE/L43A
MMLVRSSADGKTAEHRCPSCDHHEEIKGSTVLRSRKPADDSAEYARFLTPLLGMDPALPRAKGLACPYCDKLDEVLYVKYNAVHTRYIYHCDDCKAFWKRGAGEQAERVDKPADKPAEEPADKPVEEPVTDSPADKPAEEPTADKPSDDKPAKEPTADEPASKSKSSKKAAKPIESP